MDSNVITEILDQRYPLYLPGYSAKPDCKIELALKKAARNGLQAKIERDILAGLTTEQLLEKYLSINRK